MFEMAVFKFICKDCSEKFQLEVTKEKKPALVCPRCGSHKIKQDYEHKEPPVNLKDDDNTFIRCYCS